MSDFLHQYYTNTSFLPPLSSLVPTKFCANLVAAGLRWPSKRDDSGCRRKFRPVISGLVARLDRNRANASEDRAVAE